MWVVWGGLVWLLVGVWFGLVWVGWAVGVFDAVADGDVVAGF